VHDGSASLRDVNEILPIFSELFYQIWIAFGTEFHNNFLSGHEFHGSQCNESHALLRDINEIMFLLLKFIIQFE